MVRVHWWIQSTKASAPPIWPATWWAEGGLLSAANSSAFHFDFEKILTTLLLVWTLIFGLANLKWSDQFQW
jgi:hypothetical protein